MVDDLPSEESPDFRPRADIFVPSIAGNVPPCPPGAEEMAERILKAVTHRENVNDD